MSEEDFARFVPFNNFIEFKRLIIYDDDQAENLTVSQSVKLLNEQHLKIKELIEIAEWLHELEHEWATGLCSYSVKEKDQACLRRLREDIERLEQIKNNLKNSAG